MSKHIHTFKMGKSQKIESCECGKWKHANLKSEDVITEQRHTPTLPKHGGPNNLNEAWRGLRRRKEIVRRRNQQLKDLKKRVTELLMEKETLRRSHDALLEAAKLVVDHHRQIPSVPAGSKCVCGHCARFNDAIAEGKA